MQLWFIGWNCFVVHAVYTNVSELISAINVEYKMDHNVYVVESMEIDFEFIHNIHDDVANTIFESSHLWDDALQQVFGYRVLMILIFQQLDYKAIENVLSKLNYLLNGDIKFVNIFGW